MEQNTSLASRIRKELLQELVSGIYQEAVRRERSIQDKQRETVQSDPEIATKRKEVELAKLEKELRTLK